MILICAYVGDDCIDPDCDVNDIRKYINDPDVHFEIVDHNEQGIKAKIVVI